MFMIFSSLDLNSDLPITDEMRS